MLNLDIPTADDMDMHSDSGLDFGDGDGDIDLDLEPAPLTKGEDEDVSIIDAASDVGQAAALEEQEQDDFMVDPEDAIGEDDMYHDGEDAIVVEETSTDAVAVSQSPAGLQPDEDLIDYSDDEGEQPSNVLNESQGKDRTETQEGKTDDVLNQQEEPQISEMASSADVDHFDHLVQNDASENYLGTDEINDQQQTPDPSHAELTDHGDDKSVDGDEGGVFLHEHSDRATAEPTDNEPHQPEPENHDDTENDPTDENEDYEDQSPAELHSITVNYAGNELWLFKQHDPDDSGDWLLDDVSLLKSRISDVFSACRISLGDNVSNEHELGFRFDHLHNLELWEENTACVAVSLEKLVDLYRTLQLQDGIQEPDSFYISLLSRPRFVALLSDVARFAENGSGYSALNAAVAAGETHFANVFSESPSEEVTEWDDEQPGDVVTDGQEDSTRNEVQQDEDPNNDASQQLQQYESITHQTSAEDPSLRAYESDDTFALATNDSADANNASTKDEKSASSPYDEVDQVTAEAVSEAEARRAQEEDDLVDYSDDEGVEPAEQAKVSSTRASSPSSSTVHGDEKPSVANDNVDFVGSPSGNAQETEVQTKTEHDDHGEQPEAESKNAATQPFQNDVTQNYHNADKEFDDFQGEGECDSKVDCQFAYDTNPDFATYDGQVPEQHTQPDVASESELYQEGEGLSLNDYTESDVYLDFDNNASAWVPDPESNVHLPEDATLEQDDDDAFEGKETGITEQDLAAVPSDATVVAVSSSEANTMSPQGQKRSIDEAGHGVDDAFEPIGTLPTCPSVVAPVS